jgi:hypothetical protein
MRSPGFNADSSLYRSSRTYRSQGGVQARAGRSSVLPQQDDRGGADGGTCCGTHCASLCVCDHGHGTCHGHVVERVATADRVLLSANFCHADKGVSTKEGFGYKVAACEGPCWASTYDAGCL